MSFFRCKRVYGLSVPIPTFPPPRKVAVNVPPVIISTFPVFVFRFIFPPVEGRVAGSVDLFSIIIFPLAPALTPPCVILILPSCVVKSFALTVLKPIFPAFVNRFIAPEPFDVIFFVVSKLIAPPENKLISPAGLVATCTRLASNPNEPVAVFVVTAGAILPSLSKEFPAVPLTDTSKLLPVVLAPFPTSILKGESSEGIPAYGILSRPVEKVTNLPAS